MKIRVIARSSLGEIDLRGGTRNVAISKDGCAHTAAASPTHTTSASTHPGRCVAVALGVVKPHRYLYVFSVEASGEFATVYLLVRWSLPKYGGQTTPVLTQIVVIQVVDIRYFITASL